HLVICSRQRLRRRTGSCDHACCRPGSPIPATTSACSPMTSVGRLFMHPHNKLFIPCPVEASEKTWAAFCRPSIGHRGEEFRNLYREIHPKLQTLFSTKQPVFLSTSSAWGVMEASIRNLVDRSVLCCMCGAFSDKWFDVAKRSGKNAEALQVEWGKHIDPKDLDRQLATGKFDTVTLTHSETSTGVI